MESIGLYSIGPTTLQHFLVSKTILDLGLMRCDTV
jgi:hypothetical protein